MGFIPQIGIPELLIVLVVAVLVLGPKRLPAAAKSVGQGMRNFRDSLGGNDSDDDDKPKSEIDEKSKTEA